MGNPNIGWLYYKDYYSNLKESSNFKAKSDNIINQKLPALSNIEIGAKQKIPLSTTYPGLLLGSGYTHETGGDEEFKIGFYFDYTSGLPVVPGSSVKGALRSVFPFHNKNLGERFRNGRIGYIKELINDICGENIQEEQIKAIELEIFEGKVFDTKNKKIENLPINERDIFFDAVIDPENEEGNKFLSSDYITHHPDPLKNPNPIMFLKILPEIKILFQFDVKKSKTFEWLTAKKKEEIFKNIILDIGVGAKTNVGYGQFEDFHNTTNNISNESKNEKVKVITPSFYNKKLNYKRGDIIDAEVIESGTENKVKVYINNDYLPIMPLKGIKNKIEIGKIIMVDVMSNKKGKVVQVSFYNFKN